MLHWHTGPHPGPAPETVGEDAINVTVSKMRAADTRTLADMLKEPFKWPKPPEVNQKHVFIFREGDRGNRYPITLTVVKEYAQKSWMEFADKIKDTLLITTIEGVYSDDKQHNPVICIDHLVEGGTYMVRCGENNALVRSLTVDKDGRYPFWDVVERNRAAHKTIIKDVAEFPDVAWSQGAWANERVDAHEQRERLRAELEEGKRVQASLPDPMARAAQMETNAAIALAYSNQIERCQKLDAKETKISYEDWLVETTRRENAEKEAAAAEEERKRLAALERERERNPEGFPLPKGTEVTCVKGFYKKRAGRVTEATHTKVKLVFHEGDAPLTWMEVNKLERVPEPEPEPEVDPDALVEGPRDEKAVLAHVKAADDDVLQLLDMFEPIENGDPRFVESIRYRATQALALTSRVQDLNKKEAKTAVKRFNTTLYPYVCSDACNNIQVVILYTQLILRFSDYGEKIREALARDGGLETVVAVSLKRFDDVRVQQMLLGCIFNLVVGFPRNRRYVVEKALDQLVIPICTEYSNVADVVCYSFWLIGELIKDSDMVDIMRENGPLLVLAQCINTQTYENEHVRYISGQLVTILTQVEDEAFLVTPRKLAQKQIHLPDVKMREIYGAKADDVLLGRTRGSMTTPAKDSYLGIPHSSGGELGATIRSGKWQNVGTKNDGNLSYTINQFGKTLSSTADFAALSVDGEGGDDPAEGGAEEDAAEGSGGGDAVAAAAEDGSAATAASSNEKATKEIQLPALPSPLPSPRGGSGSGGGGGDGGSGS